MKLVYSDPKTGKSGQMELDEDKTAVLMSNKTGDEIDGALIGLSGYKLKITGGSDSSGFPMHGSIQGAAKVSVLSTVSFSGRHKGQHQRHTVRGTTVPPDVAQLNTVITEFGDKPASELFPEKKKAEEPAAEEKK